MQLQADQRMHMRYEREGNSLWSKRQRDGQATQDIGFNFTIDRRRNFYISAMRDSQ